MMKPKILALLTFGRQQEQQFVEGLSEAERNATGTLESWAAKDFLGNILYWKQLQTQKLAMAMRGEVPPVWRDMKVIHQLNREAFLHYQDLSFQEILYEGDRVHETFLAQIEQLSEAQFSGPYYYEWQEGEPLWGETLGNGLWHPHHQIITYCVQNGKRELAVQFQEALLQEARQAGMPEESLGVAIYNLVCFYATNGYQEKALQLLPEALQLRPTLVEWSRHDSDLETLRADPAFQAIVTDPHLQAPTSALISAQELAASGAGGELQFIIDVRGSTEYAAGHIQGAVNIPLGQLGKRLTQIPRERPVVTYCNMHHRGESRGERAAIQLKEKGYQVQALDGGYPGWKALGLPVEEQV